MFVDTSRAVNVTMGETDNKKALDQRKKQLLKEKRKYGLADPDEEANKLSWEMFYDKVKKFNESLQFNNDLVILVGLSLWETEQVRGRDESY